jgi:hypothetical protein
MRLRHDTRLRRLALALGVYVVTTAVFFAFAARNTLVSHTPWNHFVLLAHAWLKGRLDLGGPPPPYSGNNDFAEYGGKWFVVFPPFPAVLLLPLVAIAGSAERVQDGQFFLWLAGIGPAVLFLVLEKLRRTGRSPRSKRTNFCLCLLFAFGTVYFFCAEQGTVWYAAHVVGVALGAIYFLFALDADHPFLAGLALALGFLTRSPLLFAVPLFALEAARVCVRSPEQMLHAVRRTGRPGELSHFGRRLDKARLARAYTSFSLPIFGALGFAFWHNHARFGNAFDFGYRYLTVAWSARMNKWGLFSYHYLAKNLAVVLTSLPWITPHGAAPFQINGHGLALWVTTPVFVWLVWPKKTGFLHVALWLTVAAVAVPTLFYQNTGWVQFGYRFSNDYSIFLIALLAIGGRRFRTLFWLLALWSVGVNAFGAATFNRDASSRYYYIDSSQRVLYQPD